MKMKTLVAYYSRTGTTKKVALAIAEKLGADVEEIIDTVDRSGVKGYLISGRDAMKKRLTELVVPKFDPEGYDLVVIGTPIWGWNVSVPARTYAEDHKYKFKDVAFFCTMGGSGSEKAFWELENIVGKTPLGTLTLKTAEVVKGEYSEKLKKFIETLQEGESIDNFE